MNFDQILLLSTSIGLIAFLYSSVGHAGASGYIAIMSIAEFEPEIIKPTALTLNLVVATIALGQFAGRGHFSWSILWPFALLAVPMAFLGGYLNLPTTAFNILVGAILVYSAVRFFVHPSDDTVREPPRLLVAIPVGAGLGLLSGLTGTGGGIFLTPLLLTMRWASAKTAAGASAMFILLNSAAGLLGNFSSTKNIPPIAILLIVVVIVGGTLGSYFGSKKFPSTTIKRLLAAVLLIAGIKLLLTAAT